MISMITNRSDLYQRIGEEYFSLPGSQKHKSFFYQYLKKKKDIQAARIAESIDTLSEYSAKKKRDKYILLRASYLAYGNELLTEKEYIDRFTELASVKDKETGMMKLPAEYENLTADLIEKAEETYENIFLIGCISDFFYNMGFRRQIIKGPENITEKTYTKHSERYLKEKDGYIDDLDLWSKYYIKCLREEDEKEQHRFIKDLTDEYKAKCNHLFEVLNRNKRSNALMPLYFDVASGAGVMIIGNEMLPEKDKSNKSCRIGIINFSEVTEEKISNFGDFELIMMTTLFDDVEEAFADFEEGIINGKIYSENYSEYNGELPDDVDSIFNNYFYTTARTTANTTNKRIIETYSSKEKMDRERKREETEKRNMRMKSKR